MTMTIETLLDLGEIEELEFDWAFSISEEIEKAHTGRVQVKAQAAFIALAMSAEAQQRQRRDPDAQRPLVIDQGLRALAGCYYFEDQGMTLAEILASDRVSETPEFQEDIMRGVILGTPLEGDF